MTPHRSVFAGDMPFPRPLASRIWRSASLGLSAALAIRGSAADSHAAGTARRPLDLARESSIVDWGCAIFSARATSRNPDVKVLQSFGEMRDVMPRKLGPPSGATEGGSEAAGQQERSLDGGATSGSEASCRASKPKVSRNG
jgi:hypothetical protein